MFLILHLRFLSLHTAWIAKVKLIKKGIECRNAVKELLGRRGSLQDCASAVHRDPHCGRLFEWHWDNRRCSCLAPGAKCDEKSDGKVTRYELHEFGELACAS